MDDDSSELSYPGNTRVVRTASDVESDPNYVGGGTTNGSSGNNTSSSSENGNRRRAMVTMDGIEHGGTATKKLKVISSDAARIIEMGKEFARSELFDDAVFYPHKDCWNLTEHFGRIIVRKCNLPLDWDDPNSVEHWKMWWQAYKASKNLREAHTRRRRTVVERIKTTFVGKCRRVVVSFAGDA